MKASNIFIILIVLLLSSCMNFNPTYDRLSIVEKKKYEPKDYDSEEINNLQILDTNINIYKFDIDILKDLIKQSNKKYFLLVSYTFWCPSSKAVFDSIVNFDYSNTQLLLFTPDDWYYLPNYKRFLKKKQYFLPTYILDINKFGFGYNPHNRFDNFKNEISSDLNDIGGFPSYILIDRNFKIVFKRSGGDISSLFFEINRITSVN